MSGAQFTPGSPSALQYLNQLLAARSVDSTAADAVFSREGASGGIGDGGHAFGPGQFNNAGGVWTGRDPGATPEQLNQAAWSPQGLTELANDVAKVAAGQKGNAAIQSIVTGFERPRNEPAEIQGAEAAYGSAPLAAAATQAQPQTLVTNPAPLAAAATATPSVAPLNRQGFAAGLIGVMNQRGGIDANGLLQAIAALRT